MIDTIPKVIHYCWFGGSPLPALAKRCIESWKKFLPEYEIKRWDESNFDVNIIPYTKQAYEAKKFAFVSDYARFWILYKYGGLYFDTDVEVIKPMAEIIAAGPFMGCENAHKRDALPVDLCVAPGLGLGATPGLNIYKELLDVYEQSSFYNSDNSLNLKTVGEYTSELLYKKGLINVAEIQEVAGLNIYPKDYFCPLNWFNNLTITKNTVSIHYYSASWVSKPKKLKERLKLFLGPYVSEKISILKHVILDNVFRR